MKPVDQTIFSVEDEPERGNCLSAAVASLIEVPLEEVPYFAENNWQTDVPGGWWTMLHRFLWEKGFVLHGTGYRFYKRDPNPETEDEFWDRMAESQACPNGIDGYFLVTGGSPRGWKNGHAVIYKDRKLAHDPHPSRAGVTEVWEIYKITRKPE